MLGWFSCQGLLLIIDPISSLFRLLASSSRTFFRCSGPWHQATEWVSFNLHFLLAYEQNGFNCITYINIWHLPSPGDQMPPYRYNFFPTFYLWVRRLSSSAFHLNSQVAVPFWELHVSSGCWAGAQCSGVSWTGRRQIHRGPKVVES